VVQPRGSFSTTKARFLIVRRD